MDELAQAEQIVTVIIRRFFLYESRSVWLVFGWYKATSNSSFSYRVNIWTIIIMKCHTMI